MTEHVQGALDGLATLVERVTRGNYSDEELRQEMLSWEREDARRSGKLADAAIAALEYQLAGQGLTGSMEEATEELEALQRLKAALKPEVKELRPVEVEPAPELRARFPTARTYRIGEVQIIATPEEVGWHVSVNHPERHPTWDELHAASSVAGVSTMWAYMPLSGGPPGGAAANFTVHLFERPPADL
jgi:hypothetical protein